MDWKPYYSQLPRLLQGKLAPFIGPGISLLLNSSCSCTNLPFNHLWSTVPISGVVLQGLDLLDRVQKQGVSLVGSGLSSDLQGGILLASPCSTSITMGNVPLSLQISYLRKKLFSWHDSPLELPHCFLPDYNHTAFKGTVNKFLLLK